MFKERNIPKLIIITPIFSIVILVFILLYSLINKQNNDFIKESLEIEKNYIKKQKNILEKEINNIFRYIKYQKNLLITNTKRNIQIQMNAFIQNIKYKDLNDYINQHSNSNTDFIIINLENKQIIKNKDVFFTFSITKIFENKKNYFLIEDKTNIYYFKYLRKKQLLIVLKKDIYYLLDNLKYNIARWVEFMRFENNNHFWIYTNTNVLITNKNRQQNLTSDDTNKKDSKGKYYVQDFIRLAIKKQNGSFFELYPTSKNAKNINKKLAFVKFFKEWNWVIGSGISLNEINEVIQKRKITLEQKMNKYIKTAIVIAFLLIIFISILSIYISSKINQAFSFYKQKVQKKELSLKDLNQNLNHRIKIALEEEKSKDRAMLHQSRLARMGEMLNMIAHQWRQPLSQLSSILMEIETKIMFKQANHEYLIKSTKDASDIIQYMSFTIEDFKNFFKTEKEKKDFFISKACENAITLVKDSLINQNITLEYKIIKDKKIKAYQREYSQVVLNLLLNARDALLSNNTKEAKISLCIDMKNKKSILSVQDNANGVDEKHLDHIFEPYFSTKKSQGTGLGLYMSKMIIEKNMQGVLNVQNSPKGAIFTVII